jgi:hypothetical protein
VYNCISQQYNQWFYTHTTATPNLFTVTAAHSGKCLDIRDVSLLNGAQLQQWDCNGWANQSFWFNPLPQGYFKIQPNHVSNKCLSVQNNSTANGALVVQNTCPYNSDLWLVTGAW